MSEDAKSKRVATTNDDGQHPEKTGDPPEIHSELDGRGNAAKKTENENKTATPAPGEQKTDEQKAGPEKQAPEQPAKKDGAAKAQPKPAKAVCWSSIC